MSGEIIFFSGVKTKAISLPIISSIVGYFLPQEQCPSPLTARSPVLYRINGMARVVKASPYNFPALLSPANGNQFNYTHLHLYVVSLCALALDRSCTAFFLAVPIYYLGPENAFYLFTNVRILILRRGYYIFRRWYGSPISLHPLGKDVQA